ncbi:hypothetical protein KY284_013498 [Solanum tuberosum]|nr:hypothetical protein KY284_013498 [Solanum tuberosum]
MATEADLFVILGRSIGISTYQGLSLQTRYNSTVRVNPNYPQAMTLINWVKENKTKLLSYPSKKISTSSSITPMIVTPAGQQLIFIAEISSAPSVRCKQKKRTKDRKDFECPKCNWKTSLMPRFQIDLIDNTATTTTSISAELGERLLSITAEDIFDITCTKRQSLSLNHVHEMLSNKVFEIQLRKSSWGSSNTTNATLSILSYMEKQHTPQSTTDRTSKKIKPLEISEVEVMATTAAIGPSNAPCTAPQGATLNSSSSWGNASSSCASASLGQRIDYFPAYGGHLETFEEQVAAKTLQPQKGPRQRDKAALN